MLSASESLGFPQKLYSFHRKVMTEVEKKALEVIQRVDVVCEAREWVGTKFHYGASMKGVGVACGPFLLACHRVWLGNIPEPPALAKGWHFHTKSEKFLEQIQKFCHQVELPLPGDAVLFRLGAKTRPYSHGGIVVNWPHEIIHAHFRSGVEFADTTKDSLFLTASETTFWSPW